MRSKFIQPHTIYELYKDYKNRLRTIIEKWNTENICDPPDIGKMILSEEVEELLKEIDEVDKTSFRFRYPSLKIDTSDHLQELNWRYDNSKLLPKTGLPQESGYFFDHIKVINRLHQLMQEIRSIESYLGGCWGFIDEVQNIAKDLMKEFYSI